MLAALTSSPVAVIMFDLNEQVTVWNPGAERSSVDDV
jgi:PAS domain-containing protein